MELFPGSSLDRRGDVMSDLGLIENVSAAVRTGKVERSALNLFRQGGAIHALTKLVAEGHLREDQLSEALGNYLDAQCDHEGFAKLQGAMGRYFIPPMIMCHLMRWEIFFTEDELKRLASISLDMDLLGQARERNMLLIATHPRMGLEFFHQVFGTHDNDPANFWDNNQLHFYSWPGLKNFWQATTELGWLLVSTEPVDGICGRDLTSEQVLLCPEGFQQVSMIEVCLSAVATELWLGQKNLCRQVAICRDEIYRQPVGESGTRSRVYAMVGENDTSGLAINTAPPPKPEQEVANEPVLFVSKFYKV